MSKQAIAAFFEQVAKDGNLQHALAEFATRRGFRFTPRELRDVDLNSVSGSIKAAVAPESAPPDEQDDARDDPGFGVIEFPA